MNNALFASHAALDVDARDVIRASGGDILVVGRTDSRLAANVGEDGFSEAMWRCEAFADLGADVVYFEGPDSVLEMKARPSAHTTLTPYLSLKTRIFYRSPPVQTRQLPQSILNLSMYIHV